MAPWRSRQAVSLCCLSRPKSWILDHTGAHAGAGVSGWGLQAAWVSSSGMLSCCWRLVLLLIHLHGCELTSVPVLPAVAAVSHPRRSLRVVQVVLVPSSAGGRPWGSPGP